MQKERVGDRKINIKRWWERERENGTEKELSNWVRKSERENIWIVKLSKTNVKKK